MKYKNRPFVILGVNSDTDRNRLKEAAAREGITWRSWWAGGIDGAIPQLYHVQRWPTIYVLDGRGTVRFAHIHGQALDDALESLVREAEMAAGTVARATLPTSRSLPAPTSRSPGQVPGGEGR